MDRMEVEGKQVRPEDCLGFTRATTEYLCPSAANTYGVAFIAFKIRDIDSAQVLFEVQPDPNELAKLQKLMAEMSVDPKANPIPKEDDAARFIRYNFGPGFLKLKNIGTTLVFKVGTQPLPGFRMIERHYFRDHLLKSVDFQFGFCIPNSVNTWECIYEIPELSPELEKEMIAHPFEIKSDSFYFANDNELIMHHRAEYSYA